MIQLRPNQADLQRLKEPFGKLLPGDPSKTMPELNMLVRRNHPSRVTAVGDVVSQETLAAGIDRKSTRLNSSHGYISYAVFCLKKKNENKRPRRDAGTPSN